MTTPETSTGPPPSRGVSRAVQDLGQHRRHRQPALSGCHDVRRLGNPDHDASIRVIHETLDAGITFIDTADGYSGGESEEILGKALAGGRRDDVVLAPKFHSAMSDDPNHRGNSRRWIIREVENSLRRLNTDYIDLYQIHRPDSDTAIEQTLSALTDLVHQDRIRYIGSSSFTGSQIIEAQWAARERHLEPIVSEQPSYSILVRTIEEDVLPTAARHGMGVLSYSPIAGGWLSGRWRKDADATALSPHHRGLMTSTWRPFSR